MTPLVFLAACVVATPVAIGLGTVAACWWYEAVYLKRIAG